MLLYLASGSYAATSFGVIAMARTRKQAVDEIAQNLGNRKDLDNRIITRMDTLQYEELERAPSLPFFLLSEDSYTDTVDGQERIALPSNFIREYEEGALWYKPSDSSDGSKGSWEPLGKGRHAYNRDAMGEDNRLSLTGRPTHYDIVGDYFYLAPIPDDEYRLYLKYYKHDTPPSELSDSGTNEWLTHAGDLVIAKVSLKLARELQYRRDLIQGFENDLSASWVRLNIDETARKETNTPRSMGEA